MGIFGSVRSAGVVVACLGAAFGYLVFGTSTALASVTCPTVNQSTGAVSPLPQAGDDWSGCDLAHANLSVSELTNLNLSHANLTDANFLITKINGGDLSHANLTGANLIGAKVSANATDANFSDANMTGTNLTAATISGAIMGTATITSIETFNTVGVPASLPAGWTDIDGTILGPTADAWEAVLKGADLSDLDLDEANLSGADLMDAKLAGTNLSGATLSGVISGGVTGTPSLPPGWLVANGYLAGNGANLNGADLSGTDLTSLDFSGTDLSGADLSSADLAGDNLSGANLRQANLTSADLAGASAKNANLTEAILKGAGTSGLDLTNADLFGASLASADLSGATLTGVESGSVSGSPVLPAGWVTYGGYLVGPSADLSGASLSGLSLPGGDLTGTDLSGADLTSASLTSANLTSASLAKANLTSANLDNATITGTDFTGVTWLGTTCPDGSDSNAHDSGCFSALDTTPPVADPTIYSTSSEVNGWFSAPVTVDWHWTDAGQLPAATCPPYATTTTNGSITLSTTCTDLAGNSASDSVTVQVDTSRPVVKVTGVATGAHYVVGQVPAAGCTTIEKISGIGTAASLGVATGGKNGVGPFSATCAGAVSVAGLPQAAPVRARYTVGYGFGGYSAPRAGSTISRSSGHFTAAFGLVSASGQAIPAKAASQLAWAKDIRVVLAGPGIKAVTAFCEWSGTAREFGCTVKIPAGVKTGHSHKYTITAQEDVGSQFYSVPAVGKTGNPEVVHFR